MLKTQQLQKDDDDNNNRSLAYRPRLRYLIFGFQDDEDFLVDNIEEEAIPEAPEKGIRDPKEYLGKLQYKVRT